MAGIKEAMKRVADHRNKGIVVAMGDLKECTCGDGMGCSDCSKTKYIIIKLIKDGFEDGFITVYDYGSDVEIADNIKISDKVMSLQCNVHIEKISNLQSTIEKDVANCNRKINGLCWAFVLVVVIGIVLNLWMKHTISQRVSMAEGAEGYRMSQMIYRDLYKGGIGYGL